MRFSTLPGSLPGRSVSSQRAIDMKSCSKFVKEEVEMARRLNWEKAAMAGKRKLSLQDEQKFLDRGRTARWLEWAEKRRRAKARARQCRWIGSRSKDPRAGGAPRIHKQKCRP